MKIEILGAGCPKCAKTEELVRRTVEKSGLNAEIEKVTDINKMLKYGIMMTPAVAVDGKIVIAGKLPSESEIKKALGL